MDPGRPTDHRTTPATTSPRWRCLSAIPAPSSRLLVLLRLPLLRTPLLLSCAPAPLLLPLLLLLLSLALLLPLPFSPPDPSRCCCSTFPATRPTTLRAASLARAQPPSAPATRTRRSRHAPWRPRAHLWQHGQTQHGIADTLTAWPETFCGLVGRRT